MFLSQFHDDVDESFKFLEFLLFPRDRRGWSSLFEGPEVGVEPRIGSRGVSSSSDCSDWTSGSDSEWTSGLDGGGRSRRFLFGIKSGLWLIDYDSSSLNMTHLRVSVVSIVSCANWSRVSHCRILIGWWRHSPNFEILKWVIMTSSLIFGQFFFCWRYRNISWFKAFVWLDKAQSGGQSKNDVIKWRHQNESSKWRNHRMTH